MENQIELNGVVFRRCVNHYPTTYVSGCGLIYDSLLEKILDIEIRFRYGYNKMSTKNIKGGISDCAVHRVVALYWIENDRPDVAVQVNHINFQKLDNRFENLEWCTQGENYIHYLVNRHRSKEDIINDPWGFRKCIDMANILDVCKNDKSIARAMQKYNAIDELLGIGIEVGNKENVNK